MRRILQTGWIAALVLFAGCSVNEELARSDTQALSFDTYVSKGTRAVVKTQFETGDDFGVIAYVHDAAWADGIDKEQLMPNTRVVKNGESQWTYSPICYWDEGRKHTFLAYSPYNSDYLIEEDVIQHVEVAAKASEQIDLLYAVTDEHSKDLMWNEGRRVLLTFRHALSQVKFSIKTDQDYSGYYSASVTGVRVKGIDNAGKLNLKAADATVSPWSETGYTANYFAQTGTLDVGVSEALTPVNTGNELFMLLPQTIAENTVTFEFVLDITSTSAGNASHAGTGKVLTVAVPAVVWEQNKIYHYQIDMSLQQLLGLTPIEVGDPDIVDWESGTAVRLPEDLTISIPGTDGDAQQNGTGETTLGVTKSNEAGQTQEVQIENPEESDQWIASVGADITAETRSRATVEPADWVKIAKTPTGTGSTKLYGTEDASIYIQIVEENTLLAPRKAEVLIKRALTGATRIVVTQAPAAAAIIEANTTQFGVAGGANQFTVRNGSSVSWTLAKTDAPWLKLSDKADATGNEVTGGVTTQVVYAVAKVNTTSAARKATITLTQGDQDPVTVEVTQAAPQPMTLSASSVLFVNTGGVKTLTVTNPEYALDGFGWSLSTAADWLSFDRMSSTENIAPVTITAPANPTGAARSAEITLTRAGQADLKIAVIQDAPAAATIVGLDSKVYSLPSKAGKGLLRIDNPAPQLTWTVTSDASWLKVGSSVESAATTVTGTENAVMYIISDANTTSSERPGALTLSRAGQAPVTMSFMQIAAEPATLSMTSASFTYAGGSQALTVNNPNPESTWTLTSNASWLTVTPASGTETAAVILKAATNTTAYTRSGVITLTRSGQSAVSLTVTQTGIAPITISNMSVLGTNSRILSSIAVKLDAGYGSMLTFKVNNPMPELPWTITTRIVSDKDPSMFGLFNTAGTTSAFVRLVTKENNTGSGVAIVLTIKRAQMEDIEMVVVKIGK